MAAWKCHDLTTTSFRFSHTPWDKHNVDLHITYLHTYEGIEHILAAIKRDKSSNGQLQPELFLRWSNECGEERQFKWFVGNDDEEGATVTSRIDNQQQ